MTNKIKVKRAFNRLFPCVRCKYYNNANYPLTEIHNIQQNSLYYLSNISSVIGTGLGVEIIGECSDFSERK